MMSQIPINIDNLDDKDIDREIARVGLIAELDAINLYEQLAARTTSDDVKKILLDIAKEEKTHVGEFQALLLDLDNEQTEEMSHGVEEVGEILG